MSPSGQVMLPQNDSNRQTYERATARNNTDEQLSLADIEEESKREKTTPYETLSNKESSD